MTWKKIVLFSAPIAVLVALMAWWFLRAKPETTAAPKPEMIYVVETTVVTPRPNFVVERRYIGTIKAAKFSLLAPKSAGTVARIEVQAGQKVYANQLLVSLTGTSEGRTLAFAENNLKLAKEKLERSRALYRSHDITKSQLDAAEAEVLTAKTKFEEHRQIKEKIEIRAPFDGVVGVPRVVLGETVEPSAPIISVMDGPFVVFINIPSSRLAEVKEGQRVTLKSSSTTISAVERSVDPKTRTGFARATLEDCSGCIVGDSVNVSIGVYEKENAILITRNAIFYQNKKPHVVLVKKDLEGKLKAEIKEIVIGEEQEGEMEVVQGLAGGDEIITANPKRIPEKATLSVVQ